MTKSSAIKKLNKTYAKYDLNVETVSSGGNATTATAKAFIVIFENTEKGSIIIKKSANYGTGTSITEAQDNAIVNSVEGLGL